MKHKNYLLTSAKCETQIFSLFLSSCKYLRVFILLPVFVAISAEISPEDVRVITSKNMWVLSLEILLCICAYADLLSKLRLRKQFRFVTFRVILCSYHPVFLADLLTCVARAHWCHCSLHRFVKYLHLYEIISRFS